MMRLVFSRSLWLTLFYLALIMLVAVVINLIGINQLGGIIAWETWRAKTYWYMLAWRLLLYAFLICGWLWLYRRIARLEPTADSRARLLRGGIFALLTLVLFELEHADVL